MDPSSVVKISWKWVCVPLIDNPCIKKAIRDMYKYCRTQLPTSDLHNMYYLDMYRTVHVHYCKAAQLKKVYHHTPANYQYTWQMCHWYVCCVALCLEDVLKGIPQSPLFLHTCILLTKTYDAIILTDFVNWWRWRMGHLSYLSVYPSSLHKTQMATVYDNKSNMLVMPDDFRSPPPILAFFFFFL